ncbi:MAG TPA: hypothetical protein VMU54_05390, partial [Planctomycetota bacterium]|nr:hypothetical protein [Planctomycetota bacterium]
MRSLFGGRDRATLQRWAFLWMLLVAVGWFWLIPKCASAQEKKEEPRPGAEASKQNPAAAPAPPVFAAPRGDPKGTATGDENTAIDAGGTAFPVADPGEAPDPRKITNPKEFAEAKKAWDEKKKAFDDYAAQVAKEPLALKLAKAVGHNRVSINMMWTLITGFLVMFMQAGFAMVETGLCRAKNVSHTMAMNFLIYPLSMLGFYVCGFAFMFGGFTSASSMGGPAVMDGVWSFKGWNIIGTKGFFLQGNFYDTTVFALFFFQMVFMDT